MAEASAVLVPSQWEEPFGLVPCEAQAAGAPVVGYAIGALPEIVEDGRTGWLVAPGDIAAAADALARVDAIARRDCRARVEERFSVPSMLDAYEQVYAKLARAVL
jgi:glycosyltransferase involved in cell wall biosynthesis